MSPHDSRQSAENERRRDLGLAVIPEATAPHICVKGWIGENAEGLPIPCLTCRPWLRRPTTHSTKELHTMRKQDPHHHSKTRDVR